MTTTRNNGPGRPSRADRDPDRRPSEPLPDGFFPAPLTVCRRCAAIIPASERATQLHQSHHETIAGLEDSRLR
jgi:hypothetical protein